jgi:hypothetical protein
MLHVLLQDPRNVGSKTQALRKCEVAGLTGWLEPDSLFLIFDLFFLEEEWTRE